MKKIYFNLDEANQMIPFLTNQIDELRTLKQQIHDYIVDMQEDGIEIERIQNKKDLNDAEQKKAVELETMADQINAIVLELTQRGILLKDIEKGLVDFYCKLQEKDVFLCWKYGEDEIKYFHDIQEGFLGRQTLFQKNILENITQVH